MASGSKFDSPAGVPHQAQQGDDGVALDAVLVRQLLRRQAPGAGIPQLAVGTNYVPRDMMAMLHEGEEVTPKAWNPAAGGRAGNNAEMAAALRAMADRLDRIEANTRAAAGHAAATDRKLARVIPGNALITEVAA